MRLPFHHLLVTGGAGFVGSHFIRAVLESPEEVRLTNVDKLTYAGNLENLAGIAGDPRYRLVRADIAGSAVRELLRTDPPHAIINFAAETHVDRSISAPQAFVATNVLGAQNLLDGAREVGVSRFLQVSTDEVYGAVGADAAAEDSPLVPSSPYAATKAAADLLCLAHWRTYGTPVIICRAANTYGPYQFPEKLIPLAITNILTGQPVPVYGDGSQRRDWLHVSDHCGGVIAALVSGSPGEIYNIARGQERENIEVVERVLALLQGAPRLIQHIADRPGHDQRYTMRAEKLRALGWCPQVPFEQGLSETVAWYRERPDWWQPIRHSRAFREFYARQYPSLPPLPSDYP